MESSVNSCFISPGNNCEHCLTDKCKEAVEFLNNVDLKHVISQGVQGVVVDGVLQRSKTEVAIKFSILNKIPVTMTRRRRIKCDTSWSKLPGAKKLKKLYLTSWIGKSKRSIHKPMKTKTFIREAKINKILSDMKVGPHVYFSATCKNGLQTDVGKYDVGIIVMEKYDKTLSALIEELGTTNISYIKHRVSEISKVFKDLRIIADRISHKISKHGDLHGKNIIIKLIGTYKISQVNKYKVAIIDFGFDQSKNETIENIDWETDFEILTLKVRIAHILQKRCPKNSSIMNMLI